MTRRFSAVLESSNWPASVAGEWSEDHATTLDMFLDQYERMADSRPVKNGIPCEVTVKISDGQAAVDTRLPSDDDLDILFQRLRLFVLHNERISFDNVCSILKRYLRNTPLLDFIKEQQRLFRNSPEHVPGRMVFNGLVLSDEARLNDWIYGYQFHGDENRRAVFESHGIDVRHPAVRRTFVGLLLNKLNAVTNVASVTAVFMGRNSQFALHDAVLIAADASSGS